MSLSSFVATSVSGGESNRRAKALGLRNETKTRSAPGLWYTMKRNGMNTPASSSFDISSTQLPRLQNSTIL